MKTSTSRILTTHVGSMLRPESLTTLIQARLGGQAIDEALLAVRTDEAVTEVVRQQAEVGLDVISDGELGKASFLAYADERLTGFVTLAAQDPDLPASSAGGSWARRIDTRREWWAFRAYYQDYLPRAMPRTPSGPVVHSSMKRCWRSFNPAMPVLLLSVILSTTSCLLKSYHGGCCSLGDTGAAWVHGGA